MNEAIAEGIKEVLVEDKEKGQLDPAFKEYFEHGVPSIRSCVQASGGWDLLEEAAKTMEYAELLAYANTLQNLQCFVESDYVSAEVRALGFMSGDLNLINMLTQPDMQFAVLRGGEDVVRVGYSANCGIPVDRQDAALLLARTDKTGRVVGYYSPKDLEVDAAGELVHPSRDLHWELAELIQKKPRELMVKKRDRNFAKVGRFSSVYGASPKTIELKIESDTGITPEPGTGQAILDALAALQPMAEDYLIMLEKLPETATEWRAASGRIRHFALHPENISGIAGHLKKSVLGAMGRQMRNFPFQNGVGDTASRAAVSLLHYYRKNDIDAVPLLVLYDSVVTRCHLRDRFLIAPLHQRFMTDENCWEHHGRKWNYPAEHEFVTHWSESPKGKLKQLLQDKRFVGA